MTGLGWLIVLAGLAVAGWIVYKINRTNSKSSTNYSWDEPKARIEPAKEEATVIEDVKVVVVEDAVEPAKKPVAKKAVAKKPAAKKAAAKKTAK